MAGLKLEVGVIFSKRVGCESTRLMSLTSFQFPKEPVPWPSTDVRRASVSSFGYGGSNSHVILDDAYNYLRIHALQGLHQSVGESAPTNGLINRTENGVTPSQQPYAIIPLSAADGDGTKRQAEALQSFLASHSRTKEFLSDLTYTLSSHRSLLNFRSFAVVNSVADAAEKLAEIISPSVFSSTANAPDLYFVFTGQGAQYARMGTGLMGYDSFRHSLERCDEYLRTLGSTWSVLEELDRVRESSKVNNPALSQPLCTAIQIGIVDLFRSWGIAPRAVVGHSSGEIAAAYCAQGLDRESAWKVAYFRGEVADKLASDQAREATTMMSVGLGQEAIQGYLKAEPSVTVACMNSPVNVTLSGPTTAIVRLSETLDREEVFSRKLAVKIGYHSEALRDGAAEYERLIRDIQAPTLAGKTAATTAFFSSTTGTFITLTDLASPSYWLENLLSPVKFSNAVMALINDRKQSSKFLVEIGPQPALRRPVKDIFTHLGEDGEKWKYTCVLNSRQDDVQSLLEAIGSLWSSGLPIDINQPNQASLKPKRLPKLVADLPSYPFSRAKEYWEEPRLSKLYANRPFRRHALLGLRDNDWNAAEAAWRHPIRLAEHPWILDHALEGAPLYPGTGMLVMAIEAMRQLSSSVEDRISGYRLENVRFMRSISVNDSDKGTEAKVYLRPRRHTAKDAAQSWYDWRVFTLGGDEWIECAFGSIRVELEPEETPATVARKARFWKTVAEEHAEAVSHCTLSVQSQQLYENLSKKSGFDYGPYFQGLRNIRYGRDGFASGTLALRDYAKTMPYADEDPCVIHPTTFDSVFHVGLCV